MEIYNRMKIRMHHKTKTSLLFFLEIDFIVVYKAGVTISNNKLNITLQLYTYYLLSYVHNCI